MARLSTKLIPRLAEEGPTAIPKLLRIIENGFTQPDTQNPLWGKEILSASVGLCRIRPKAKTALPDLLRLHAQYSNLPVTQSIEWRATLFALGHPIDAFPPPPGLNGINYRIKLRHQSNHCAN
ncbi:MAG: hypothetical protein FJW36_08140 [Acidobacteria bacterium]|nr:hypothetical protein [Acidobacteriota bacterium]